MNSSGKAQPQLLELICHAASPCLSVRGIKVELVRLTPAGLRLSYLVTGDISQVRVPQPSTNTRQDELWRHTCAELFVAVPGEAGYSEFNFSPSTQWAAYSFSGYRQNMRVIEVRSSLVTLTKSASALRVDVQLALPAEIAAEPQLRVGLSMVIEELSGQCSYWALKHLSPMPDFHQLESFVANV